jgi:hypothetical protein
VIGDQNVDELMKQKPMHARKPLCWAVMISAVQARSRLDFAPEVSLAAAAASSSDGGGAGEEPQGKEAAKQPSARRSESTVCRSLDSL